MLQRRYYAVTEDEKTPRADMERQKYANSYAGKSNKNPAEINISRDYADTKRSAQTQATWNFDPRPPRSNEHYP